MHQSISIAIQQAWHRRVKCIDLCGFQVRNFPALDVKPPTFHNIRGMGLPSALAGLSAGLLTSMLIRWKFGGCPFAPGATGNICTEDLVTC